MRVVLLDVLPSVSVRVHVPEVVSVPGTIAFAVTCLDVASHTARVMITSTFLIAGELETDSVVDGVRSVDVVGVVGEDGMPGVEFVGCGDVDPLCAVPLVPLVHAVRLTTSTAGATRHVKRARQLIGEPTTNSLCVASRAETVIHCRSGDHTQVVYARRWRVGSAVQSIA